MTDLEAHVKAPGRSDLVKQVRAKIKELGISYIYYQFVSVTGRIVGKGVPAKAIDDLQLGKPLHVLDAVDPRHHSPERSWVTDI